MALQAHLSLLGTQERGVGGQDASKWLRLLLALVHGCPLQSCGQGKALDVVGHAHGMSEEASLVQEDTGELLEKMNTYCQCMKGAAGKVAGYSLIP